MRSFRTSRRGELDGGFPDTESSGQSRSSRGADTGQPGFDPVAYLDQRAAGRPVRQRRRTRRFYVSSAVSALLAVVAVVISYDGSQQIRRDVQGLIPAMPTSEPSEVAAPLALMTPAQVAALGTQPDPTGTPAAMAAQFAYALQLGDEATAASQLEPNQRHTLATASPETVDTFLGVEYDELQVARTTGYCLTPGLPAFPPAGGWQPELVTVPVLCPGQDMHVTVRLTTHGPVGVHLDHFSGAPADSSAARTGQPA